MYKLDSVDRPMDGIIKIILRHKQNECKLLLFGCYIPPEHSSRGRVSHDVFSYLRCEIYGDIIDMDHIVICGDINARIGRLSDCIRNLDVSIPDRNVIDDIRNTQGGEFVEFLQEMNMCVLNGRFVDDNFTCISTKGRSVVDYICVMNDQFTMFKSFRVFTVSEMIDKYALTPLVSDRSRPLTIHSS